MPNRPVIASLLIATAALLAGAALIASTATAEVAAVLAAT